MTAKHAVTARAGAASIAINRIAESRTSSVDYWRDIERDAANFPEAFGARLMRLNAEAGHDIADGFAGLYDTLTDWEKFKALFQCLPNPKEIYSGLQESANKIQALPADKRGEGAYKLLVGGLATGGGGKLGASVGKKWGGAVGAKSTNKLGRVEGSFSAIKFGPLPNNIADTFAGGKYQVVTLAKDTSLYRAGTTDQPLGQFFSLEAPSSVVQAYIDKAVLPVWPRGAKSPIDTAFEVKIPSGTQVYVGEVGSQGGAFVGGTQQIVVTKPWIIDGVEVLR